MPNLWNLGGIGASEKGILTLVWKWCKKHRIFAVHIAG